MHSFNRKKWFSGFFLNPYFWRLPLICNHFQLSFLELFCSMSALISFRRRYSSRRLFIQEKEKGPNDCVTKTQTEHEKALRGPHWSQVWQIQQKVIQTQANQNWQSGRTVRGRCGQKRALRSCVQAQWKLEPTPWQTHGRRCRTEGTQGSWWVEERQQHSKGFTKQTETPCKRS